MCRGRVHGHSALAEAQLARAGMYRGIWVCELIFFFLVALRGGRGGAHTGKQAVIRQGFRVQHHVSMFPTGNQTGFLSSTSCLHVPNRQLPCSHHGTPCTCLQAADQPHKDINAVGVCILHLHRCRADVGGVCGIFGISGGPYLTLVETQAAQECGHVFLLLENLARMADQSPRWLHFIVA